MADAYDVEGLSSLRFALAGTVTAWCDGHAVDLGPPQRRAVLAQLLLAAGRAVGSDELIAGLWGEESPSGALSALQAHVSVLRRVLEPGRRPREASRVLRLVGRGYVLETADVEVDLFLFRRRRAAAQAASAAGEHIRAGAMLADALRDWDGHALVGVPGPAADLHRSALQMEALGAVEELLNLPTGADPSTLPVDLPARLRQHPHRESLHTAAMRALHTAGRRAEALDVYTSLRRNLVDDLGLEPGPDVRALQRTILAGDATATFDVTDLRLSTTRMSASGPAPEVRTAVPHARSGATGQRNRAAAVRSAIRATLTNSLSHSLLQAAPPRPTDALVGRTELLEQLDEVLVPHVAPPVLLHGPVGVGSTALAVEAAAAAVGRFPGGLQVVGVGAPAPTRPGSLLVVDGVHAEKQLDERFGVPSGAGIVVLHRLARAGTTVLVTGTCQLRRLLPARRFEMAPLTLDQSYELLVRHLGAGRVDADAETARRLLRHIGGLPVLIVAVAQQLTVRPSWSLAEYVDDLFTQDDEGPRWFTAMDLGAHVQHAFEPVPGAALAVLSACAALPRADFERQDVLRDGGDQAHVPLLDVLVDHHLLAEPSPGRYRMHPLLRNYVRLLGRPGPNGALPGVDYRAS